MCLSVSHWNENKQQSLQSSDPHVGSWPLDYFHGTWWRIAFDKDKLRFWSSDQLAMNFQALKMLLDSLNVLWCFDGLYVKFYYKAFMRGKKVSKTFLLVLSSFDCTSWKCLSNLLQRYKTKHQKIYNWRLAILTTYLQSRASVNIKVCPKRHYTIYRTILFFH